ncbi:FRIGIDA-like protein 4a [Diospyros lotus]|uniref:FRIGIDA-like protein 4a n=1 Tax=Diospyros lotus TaxID=55363 RepID=UPI00224F8454|nr:FRIGIDA-like protein 4a [Diospyros lotus]
MGSLTDPGGGLTQSTPPSFDKFQRQASLMTSCTLLWKELSDHFSSLEQNLQKKSKALKDKITTLDTHTKESLQVLQNRECTIDDAVSIALDKVYQSKEAALLAVVTIKDSVSGEVDDGEGLLLKLRSYCTRMDAEGFWRFVSAQKKELDSMRTQMPVALGDSVDPAKFVLEAISEVFPVDNRADKSDRANDLGWACVLMLESLIPAVVDPILGNSRLLVTPSVKERAKEIAETWKASLDERGGIENVKTPDVHTFLQHLVTFGIVKKEDIDLYRKLVVGSAWRKQMPKLAVSLGLGDKMPDLIEELISRGQQVDAIHFTFEVGLQDKFPPVPLLKAFLKDAKKAATSILVDPKNSGRAAHLAARKEQSALRAVIKCIEEYKLEAEFPPENLKKRLEQLEKTKSEKKKAAAVPANKRTRVNNGGPMPPAKAGRSTNAYVSSFPAPAFVRSPSHTQYATGIPQYPASPVIYSSRSPPYAYSPEAASPPLAGSYPVAPINYSPYGGYGNGVAPAYQQAYY